MRCNEIITPCNSAIQPREKCTIAIVTIHDNVLKLWEKMWYMCTGSSMMSAWLLVFILLSNRKNTLLMVSVPDRPAWEYRDVALGVVPVVWIRSWCQVLYSSSSRVICKMWVDLTFMAKTKAAWTLWRLHIHFLQFYALKTWQLKSYIAIWTEIKGKCMM